jgi:putative addiction module component (TIGR02574 family)
MPADIRKLLDEVLKLDASARALVAETLLASLDADDEVELSDEWRDEIRRRCDEIDNGAVTPVEGGVVLAELRAKLGT